MKRSYYRFTGRRQRVNGTAIKAWRRLVKAAQGYAPGDIIAFDALRKAYDDVKTLPVIGQDSPTNPCQSLRDAARIVLFRAVFFHRPDDLTFYAQKVDDLCAAEESLNAAMKAAG